jgi:SAM-dependent methyltransferase
MPDEASLFQTTGLPWSERASLDGLNAVLSPTGEGHRNIFLHGIHEFGATLALRYFRPGSKIIDFGCGTGRFAKFFASRRRRVHGTEVTPEMLERAKSECTATECEFVLTNGVDLPSPTDSVDGIWCCAVLRYSLFVSNPAYSEIAREMYRVLRPGGYVVNCEMYVDVGPDAFVRGFDAAGFTTESVRVLHRYGGRLEQVFRHRFIPEHCVARLGKMSAFLRAQFDNPERDIRGLRDYLFVWQKPPTEHASL